MRYGIKVFVLATAAFWSLGCKSDITPQEKLELARGFIGVARDANAAGVVSYTVGDGEVYVKNAFGADLGDFTVTILANPAGSGGLSYEQFAEYMERWGQVNSNGAEPTDLGGGG